MWKERMVYEQLRIEIQHGPGDILGISSADVVVRKAISTVGEDFPNTLVVRSSQWGRYVFLDGDV